MLFRSNCCVWFVICFRFIPPENFDLALLTLELEFVKKGTKSEQVIIDFQSIILVLTSWRVLFYA